MAIGRKINDCNTSGDIHFFEPVCRYQGTHVTGTIASDLLQGLQNGEGLRQHLHFQKSDLSYATRMRLPRLSRWRRVARELQAQDHSRRKRTRIAIGPIRATLNVVTPTKVGVQG